MTVATPDSQVADDNDESSHHSVRLSLDDESSRLTGPTRYETGMPDSILTKQEVQVIKLSRIIVLIVLALVGVAAVILTWLMATKLEEDDFENKVPYIHRSATFVARCSIHFRFP